jgi:hypothetical protein
VFHSSSVEKEWMCDNNITGQAGYLMKVPYRLTQHLAKEIPMGDTRWMPGENSSCPLVGSQSKDGTTPAGLDISEQPHHKQALFRAINCMRKPVSVNVPACGWEIVWHG